MKTIIKLIASYVVKLVIRACFYFVLFCNLACLISWAFNYSIDIAAISFFSKLVLVLFFVDMFKFGIDIARGKIQFKIVKHTHKKQES